MLPGDARGRAVRQALPFRAVARHALGEELGSFLIVGCGA
jgi:hypothetical protein